MKIAINLLVTLTSLLLSCSVQAFDNYKDFAKGNWDLDFSTQYYRTESNFGSSSTQENLSSGNHYQIIDMTFGTRFVVGSKTAFFGSGSIGAAESKSFTGTRTGSAFNQMVLGMEYLAYSGKFELIPEASVLMPLQKSSMESGDDVIISEGVLEFRPQITAQKDFGRFAGYVRGGFTYRAEGRSFLLPWGFGGFSTFGTSRLGAELFGYQSMTDDDENNNKFPRQAHLSNVNGGSYKYGAFSPSIVDTNFFYHYNVRGPFSFQLDIGLPLTGTNISNGMHVGAMLRYSFDFSRGEPKATRYTPTPREAPRGKSEMYGQEEAPLARGTSKFKEDTSDGVDQRIFKTKALNRKKKTGPALQEQLDDVEMQIELKNTRGKKRR